MKKGYSQPYIRHCKTSLFSEKGEKQKTRKIYFQHSQHNKINDLLLYHHNVLRVSERAPTTIPPSLLAFATSSNQQVGGRRASMCGYAPRIVQLHYFIIRAFAAEHESFFSLSLSASVDEIEQTIFSLARRGSFGCFGGRSVYGLSSMLG